MYLFLVSGLGFLINFLYRADFLLHDLMSPLVIQALRGFFARFNLTVLCGKQALNTFENLLIKTLYASLGSLYTESQQISSQSVQARACLNCSISSTL